MLDSGLEEVWETLIFDGRNLLQRILHCHSS
jgi:hypothetical protein